MAYFGYHRTSTQEQYLDRGITEITEYCKTNGIELEKLYTDQHTGKSFNRPNYQILANEVLREGDTLIITEIDRLGRSKKDTMKQLQGFKDKGIRLMVLELPTTLVDTSKMNDEMAKMMLETINNMMIELYVSMAHAELNKKEKRQREGIQAKKDRGEWDNYGRPKTQKPKNFDKIVKMVESGEITNVEAMKLLELKKTTYYKLLKEQ